MRFEWIRSRATNVSIQWSTHSLISLRNSVSFLCVSLNVVLMGKKTEKGKANLQYIWGRSQVYIKDESSILSSMYRTERVIWMAHSFSLILFLPSLTSLLLLCKQIDSITLPYSRFSILHFWRFIHFSISVSLSSSGEWVLFTIHSSDGNQSRLFFSHKVTIIISIQSYRMASHIKWLDATPSLSCVLNS